MVQFKSLLFLALASVGHSASIRGGETERRLQASSSAYYSTSDTTILGAANPDAAIGNPLKGLMSSPAWTGGTPPAGMPSSLEFHYVGMDRVMTGDNKFDWAVLDKTIQDAASRNNHVIWRVYIHYPGRTLALPKYLIDAGVKLVQTQEAGLSPQYEDPKLLVALEQLIKAMGARYDGHKSIAFIQLGLLGYWGEWHTYPDKGILADSTQDKVVEWYKSAFVKTRCQTRGLTKTSVQSGMGLHDDSFAYSTLSSSTGWFFWPQVVAAGQTNFWKTTVMGGETRPELQDTIFEPSYVPGDKYKQDFMQCVETTHATYMLNSRAFGDGGYQGEELNRARRAHARMGYNFQVSNVAVSRGATSSTVAVDVTVKQVGVAPFYYQLNLALTCPGTSETVSGVETLIENGSTKVFRFASIPADSTCLSAIQLALQSPMMYSGKPIKFAQGNGSVALSLPLPTGTTPTTPVTPAPVTAPVRAPTPAPVAPVPVPVTVPVPVPTPGSEGISALRLMYTGSPSPHSSVMNLVSGAINVVDLAALNLPSAAFNVEAVRTSTAVQSVVFSNNRLDNGAPFSFCGNSGQNFATCNTFTVGSTVTVSVVGYPLANNQGTPFPTVSATIQIVDSRIGGPVPVPAPVPVPVPVPVPAPVPVATPVAAPMFFTDAREKSGPRFKILMSTSVSSVNDNMVGLPGYQGDVFRHHRYGSGGFSYVISGFAPGSTQSITLGFAETYTGACGVGKRVFSVLANGASFASNLDVFAVAGCKKAYIVQKSATADASGIIELKFVSGKQNPFVSFIDIKAQ